MATYAARGLHPAVGFLVAWGYVLVGWLIPPLVLLQLGFTTAATLNSEFSGYPASLWWPWALLGALIVLAAGFYGIRTSARLGTILGVSEIAVFLVLAVFLVVHAGSRNTLSVFGTGYTPPGFRGITGVIAGSVFTILAFGGFEGAAPLAEEARNPRRTIQRAVLLATLLIGALYVFTTYAVDVAFGPKGFAGFTTGTGSASWVGLARSLFITPLTPPLSDMGPGVAAWMVVGVFYLVYLYRRDPRRVVEVGLVHLDRLETYDGA